VPGDLAQAGRGRQRGGQGTRRPAHGSLLSIFKGETNENIRGKNTKGTHWSGYQTVVEYVDHFAPVRDTENAARIRAERALMGKALDTEEQAFKLFQVA
jgi:hypothetical protein